MNLTLSNKANRATPEPFTPHDRCATICYLFVCFVHTLKLEHQIAALLCDISTDAHPGLQRARKLPIYLCISILINRYEFVSYSGVVVGLPKNDFFKV